MAANIYIGEILENEEIQEDCFLMKVKTAPSFQNPLPGQFVMIRIAGLNDPFLSRPISIYSFSRNENYCVIELLYRVVGKGTQIMAGLIEDSQVEINGPLGNGFNIQSVKENIVIVSGGIGIAPLSLLIEYLRQRDDCSSSEMIIYPGFQSASAVIGLDKMQKLCRNITVCTDDGTLGNKGFVTQIFQKDMKKYTPENTSLYACGPKEMLKALAKILHNTKFDCQVSLEERMACGTGACVGCAVAVKDKQGDPAYKRVCADGPVFNLTDIIWE
ncbi:MAG: dihydroorotate dehydrogenase electron transfer subunit [Deltaproteobacteria bacterium HGW-Deltaproteobacteria-13]|jgi:dihydroorotate dehydrogenase electron transfer subunit|nr:MAG: dihydroorotate dehydrogenase electron transfer subunit [Deltaproteobacteria bacterium HGW-Deltaproteobacteria-13]